METSKQNEIIIKIGKLKFKNANKIPNNIFVSEMKSGYEETSLVEFIFNKMKAYNSPYADAREVYSWSNVLVNYNFNIKNMCYASEKQMLDNSSYFVSQIKEDFMKIFNSEK
jgi:hypothetical protein